MSPRVGRLGASLSGLCLTLIALAAARPMAGMPAAELEAGRAGDLRLVDARGGVAPSLAGPVAGRVFLAQGARIEAYPARPASSAEARVELRSPILPGLVIDMHAADGRLYASLLDRGLWILDATSLDVVGVLPTRLGGAGLAILDGHAYLADDERGVLLVDVSDSSAPRALGHLAMPDRGIPGNLTAVESLRRAGDHLLVGYWDREAGGDLFAVFELTDPAQPRLASIVDLAASPVRPGPARCPDPPAVVRWQYRLYALDLCDAEDPRLVGLFPGEQGGEVVASAGGAGHHLLSLRVDEPETGTLREGLVLIRADAETGFQIDLARMLETRAAAEVLHLAGDLGWALDAAPEGGLRLRWLDRSGEDLVDRASVPVFSHSAGDVVSLANGSWVATAQEVLWRYATTEAGEFGSGSRLGSRELWDAAAVARVEGHLFAAGGASVVVVDARRPESMRQIAVLDQGVFGRPVVDLAGAGERLVMVTRGEIDGDVASPPALFVFDASLPASPVLLGSLDLEPAGVPGSSDVPIALELVEDRALVAFQEGVRVVDLRDPSHPELLNAVPVPEGVAATSLNSRGQVFVATLSGAIEVYGQDEGWSLEQQLDLDATILGLAATEDMVVALTAGEDPPEAGPAARIRIFEHADDRPWAETRSLAIPGDAYLEPVRIALSGDRIALAMQGYGLQLIDLGTAIEAIYLPRLGVER